IANRRGAIPTLAVTGRLGSWSRNELALALCGLEATRASLVMLDLRNLTGIDEESARWIVRSADRVRDRGGHLAVKAAAPPLLAAIRRSPRRRRSRHARGRARRAAPAPAG